MAPIVIERASPLLRTSTTADLDVPAAKKQCSGLLRHHNLTWNPEKAKGLYSPCQDGEAIQSLLSRSICLALEAVGFKAADPVAIDSFRAEAEEYMAHFLTEVRRCMHASRRTQPIPQDFLQSLHTHQLTLKSLRPHLDPPVPPLLSQITLSPETAIEEKQHQLPFLGPTLNGTSDHRVNFYVPRHFPAFPSRHTYKATPKFPEREKDPRKIRERATEEGRMGEEALRRLVGAGFDRGPAPKPDSALATKSTRVRRNDVWEETMLAMTSETQAEIGIEDGMQGAEKAKAKGNQSNNIPLGGGRLSSAVNADKIYWRKPATSQVPKTIQERDVMGRGIVEG